MIGTCELRFIVNNVHWTKKTQSPHADRFVLKGARMTSFPRLWSP